MPDDVRWIHEAFWRLHRSRQIGFDVGYIPFSEIKAYTELFEVGDVEFFTTAILESDAVWVECARNKKKDNK